MRYLRIHLVAAVVTAILAACSVESPQQESLPNAPSLSVSDAITPNGAFYPLAEGNEWHYRYRFEMQLIPFSGPEPPPEVFDDAFVRRQMETVVHNGIEYRVERESYDSGPVARRYFRQDRRGLYQAAVALPDPDAAVLSSRGDAQPTRLARVAAHLATRTRLGPACVAEHLRKVSLAKTSGSSPGDGIQPGEVLLLAYPLHTRASWLLRANPAYRSTVEGVDQIAGSPAYRVRIDNEFLNPGDFVYFWYGRCGVMQYRLHVETVAIDENGYILGRLISDESFDVLDVGIARGGCDIRTEDNAGGGFNSYPMAIGNRWTYEIRSWDPLLSLEHTTIADNEQTAWVDVDGRKYMKEVMTARAPASWTSVDYVRQDRDGLYSLGPPDYSHLTAVRAAAKVAVGAIASDEAVTLLYPLKTGAAWTIRDHPMWGVWTATVEGKECLTLPAGEFNAFRIRIMRDGDLPGTDVHVWYGSAGLLKVVAHVATVDGFADEEWTLQEFDGVR